MQSQSGSAWSALVALVRLEMLSSISLLNIQFAFFHLQHPKAWESEFIASAFYSQSNRDENRDDWSAHLKARCQMSPVFSKPWSESRRGSGSLR